MLAFCAKQLFCGVVINELCYDPVGADSGIEWIELYNPTDQDINLSGSKIYSGGSTYSHDFTFPYFVLRPGRFVLIGGADVPNRHFTHNFTFQNGGTASDGVRFASADSLYTDTVVYDSPNSNLLIDDSGLPAQSLAEDTTEGSSLARIADGWDTNLCAADFRVESRPTPGLPNRVYADYALLSPQVIPEADGYLLELIVANLSQIAPLSHAQLNLYRGSELLHAEAIEPLAGDEQRTLQIWLHGSYELLFAELSLEDDPDLENNSLYISYLGDQAQAPLFSEIYPAPLAHEQEWIEVYARAARKTFVEYIIFDAANNQIRFSLPPVPGYFVLCRDKESLLQTYPDCPPAAVIETSGWAALNNDGDSLILQDLYGEKILDAMSYSSAQAVSGMALQKDFEADQGELWSLGIPNPGLDNQSSSVDLPEHEERLKIVGSPCDPKSGDEILISYKFPFSGIRVNCSIYDLTGRKIRQLADNEPLGGQGILRWDGLSARGAFAQRGLYIILWESQDASGGKIHRRQLTAVIK